MKITLEKPHQRWKYSFLTLVEEFKFHDEDLIPWVIGLEAADFDSYLKILEDSAVGVGLKEWQVPHQTYWLIAGEEVVGVSNLRLKLTEKLRRDGGHIGYGIRPSARRKGYAVKLLTETLKKAKAHDIGQCLLMCDKSNIGSAKTILKNGGVLLSEKMNEADSEIIQTYCLET